MAETVTLVWVRCRLLRGHGVASGRAAHSPYPAGTIALQSPFFLARGLDLSPFFAGTLNLEARGVWRLRDPDARFEQLRWTEHHPPETFSFWHCRLRSVAAPAGDGPPAARTAPPRTAAETAARETAALLYHPHPETKQAHRQPPGCVEVLAPWLGELQPGSVLELGVDPRRCRLIDTARLRARLLEFLKFRVLAAQEEFFTAFLLPSGPPPSLAAAAAPPPLDPALLRHWLGSLWPEALLLSDADLLATFEQARRLYLP